jgi:hypothetical protein
MVFRRMAIEGHLMTTRVLTDGTGWKPTEQAYTVLNEMPVENVVIGFPAASGAPCSSN